MNRGLALVVDDHPSMRIVLADMLQSFGFESIPADTGATGLRVFQERRQEITLIILDVVMPGMNGIELLRFLSQASSCPPILIISGGDALQNMAGLSAAAEIGKALNLHIECAEKPLSPEIVLQKIKALLPHLFQTNSS